MMCSARAVEQPKEQSLQLKNSGETKAWNTKSVLYRGVRYRSFSDRELDDVPVRHGTVSLENMHASSKL